MPNSNRLIQAITKRLAQRRFFYVCRDLERAEGLRAKNYFIITNYTAYAGQQTKSDSHIILIKEKNQLDTVDLLKHPMTQKIIKKNDFVLVFKNNSIIEDVCQKNNWRLLNPPAKLADKIESKISQVNWLGQLAKFLPRHRLAVCGQIKWTGQPFILQFNHAHTGGGTFFINSPQKLSQLAQKFPQREARVSAYIPGPVFTNNNVVWGKKILMGNINYQITGLSPFTDNKFATIGNDWALPNKILSAKQVSRYKQIVNAVGGKMAAAGWKGLFGVDIIMEPKSGRLYLLEINARQPASTTFESQLQQLVIPTTKEESLSGQKTDRDPSSATASLGMTKLTTTFEAHVAALLGLPYKKYKLTKISDGAQIVQRVMGKINKTKKLKIKDSALINIIKYNNTAPGSDLIRFQFSKGLMKKHNVLNALGKKLI